MIIPISQRLINFISNYCEFLYTLKLPFLIKFARHWFNEPSREHFCLLNILYFIKEMLDPA